VSHYKEELVEVPHFREGRTFAFHIPYNLDDLDCRLNPRPEFGELPWSPWPDRKHIERRVGDFVLKLHPTETHRQGFGKKLKERPWRLIRHVDDPPDEWMVFSQKWGFDEKLNLWSFNKRHVLSVMKEDFPDLEITNDLADTPANRKIRQLRSPPEIPEDILNKVYGRSIPRVEQIYTNFENIEQINEFQLCLEWYRKNLLKIQRRRANRCKKELAEELGVTVKDIEKRRRKERKTAKEVQFTQEWIDISTDVHNTIDFLNEVVKRMGQRERLDREWYDDSRRRMRQLASTMRRLSKFFPKKK